MTPEMEETGSDERPSTCLGLELFNADAVEGVPLDAFCIIKSLNKGHVEYTIASTEHLTGVETLGMVHWAMRLIEQGFDRCMEGDDDLD